MSNITWQDVEQKIQKLNDTKAYELDVHFNSPQEDIESDRHIAYNILKDLNLLDRNINVLDIGSGMGYLVLGLSDYINHVTGVEPDISLFEISEMNKLLCKKTNIELIYACGEDTTIGNTQFDLIISKTVLEHVDDVDLCFSEFSRLLKDDGILHIEVPNYMWIYEGHYKLPMIPLMPKWLFKIYLFILRRDTKFIEHINYITPRMIKKMCHKYALKYENKSEQIIYDILIKQDFKDIPNRYKGLSTLIKLSSGLKLNIILFKLIKFIGLYPMIIMDVKK